MIEKICVNCGKKFYKNSFSSGKERSMYCGTKCGTAYRKKINDSKNEW